MKKILSILLAICIMVGMVTMLASADEAKKAYYKLPVANASKTCGAEQKGYTMAENADTVHYYTTDTNGFAVEGADASNYNIKVTFKPGEPLTVYLKGAKISAPKNIGSSNNAALGFGFDSNDPASVIKDFDVLIVAETDSTLANSWGFYDGTSDSTHGRATIEAGMKGSLTITGPGKLDIFSDCASVISSPKTLVIKDIEMTAKLEITHQWGSFNTIQGEEITFDNAKVKVENNYNGTIKGKNITIKNGSDVYAFVHKDVESIVNVNASESYTIDNAKLLANSNGAHAINKSTVTLTGVNAIGGTKEENASAFKAGRQSGYWYLLAGPDVVIPTEPETTAPPATTKPATTKATKATTAATKATTGATTGSKATTGGVAGGNADGTQAAGGNDATTGTTPVDNNTTSEEKGGLTWLYILLGVVILAGGAVLVLVIVKRNAAVADEEELEEGEEAEEAEETEAEETEEPETTEDAE